MTQSFYRPTDALLAGVCAELARRLGWNVWAIRGIFVLGLFLQTLATGAVYAVAAVLMGLLLKGSAVKPGKGGLKSEQLGARGKRIQDLEDKFSALEREEH